MGKARKSRQPVPPASRPGPGKADAGAALPSATPAESFERRPGLTLALSAAAMLAAGLLPLLLAGLDPAALAGGGPLQAPSLVSLLALWGPASGFLVLALLALRRGRVSDGLLVLAAAVSLPPLYTLFMANAELTPPVLHGLWSRFAGVPAGLAALFAAGGVHALRSRAGGRSARVVAVFGSVALGAALLAPWYDEQGWSLPLLRVVLGLGEGSLRAVVRVLSAGALLSGAVLTLRTLLPGGAGLSQRASRVLGMALACLLGAYPLWLLGLAVEASAAGAGGPLLISLSLAAGLWGLWLAMGLRRLCEALDAPVSERSSWRGLLPRGAALAYGLAVALVFALFFLLKTHGLRPSATDENIYFYGAHLITEGLWPYRDFFFAHPPLHLLVPAGVFALFGFDVTVAKLIPALATMATGGFVLAIARRHLGRFGALAALVSFLFANEVLKASTNLTGVNLTTLWMSAGLWAALARRWLAAGVFLALAIGTGFYAIAAALALLAMAAFAGRRAFLRLALGFVGLAALLNGVFWAIGGQAYLDGVYIYHGKKLQKELVSMLLTVAHYHALPFWAFLAAPGVALLRRWQGRHTGDPALSAPRTMLDPRTLWRPGTDDAMRVVWLVNLALLLEFALFRELYAFYFVLWFPGLALLVGYLAVGLRDALLGAALHPAGPGASWRRPAALAAGALLLFGCWLPFGVGADQSLRDYQQRRIDAREIRRDTTGFLAEYEQRGERTAAFDWTPPPILESLGDVVEVLFWRGERVKGAWQPGYAWYLQSKKRYFESCDEIASYVREHSAEGETITGASTVAPLIALLSGRAMAAREIDTNNKRFHSGLLRQEDFFEAICHDRVRFVVAAPSSAFSPTVPSNHATVREHFRPARRFQDTRLKWWHKYPILLFERKGPEPAPGEPVCGFVGG